MRTPVLPLMGCVVLSLGVLSVAGACVGARALAMGGAFTGLADDVSAAYWNPAALAYLDGKDLTWMHTASNRESANVQDYLSCAVPLAESSAAGLSYLDYRPFPTLSFRIGDSLSTISQDRKLYWVSYGVEAARNTALGVNVKFVADHATISTDGVPVDQQTFRDTAVDLAFYRRTSDAVTVGLLAHNINQPGIAEVRVLGMRFKALERGRSYCPGVALRIPDQNVIIAVELYDALGDSGARALRLGIEKKLPRQRLALRAGRYAFGDLTSLTLGAGVWTKDGQWALDVAYMGGDLDGTWFVSGTAKF